MKRLIIVFIHTFLLCSCLFIKPTTNPISSISYNASKITKEHLIIFLPGMGDDMTAYANAGFFDIENSKVNFDSLAIDSHFGYYKEKILTERIYLDILKPNRSKYKKITLLGISLGAYGALKVASNYPELVDQIILMAPYMGKKSQIKDLNSHDSFTHLEKNSKRNKQSFVNAWDLIY